MSAAVHAPVYTAHVTMWSSSRNMCRALLCCAVLWSSPQLSATIQVPAPSLACMPQPQPKVPCPQRKRPMLGISSCLRMYAVWGVLLQCSPCRLTASLCCCWCWCCRCCIALLPWYVPRCMSLGSTSWTRGMDQYQSWCQHLRTGEHRTYVLSTCALQCCWLMHNRQAGKQWPSRETVAAC